MIQVGRTKYSQKFQDCKGFNLISLSTFPNFRIAWYGKYCQHISLEKFTVSKCKKFDLHVRRCGIGRMISTHFVDKNFFRVEEMASIR